MSTHCKTFLAQIATLLPLFVVLSASAQAPVQHPQPSVAAYGKVPLHFEANQGQADASAKFVAHGPGYSILLEPTSVDLVLHQEKIIPARRGAPTSVQAEAIRMTMLGANPAATMAAQQPSSTYVNYMNGPFHKDWKLGVPTYLQARTTALYPGIDVVYYGSQRDLEYDFAVAPGSDVASIRMGVTGAAPALAADGSLRLHVAGSAADRDLRFGKPVLYQQIGAKRQPVEGSFAVAANGEIGFKVGAYDHARELVIDPLISYASYFGGTAEDEINATALNAAGQLYAVGQTFSASLPGTAGEFETGSAANNNGHDAFVTKFSADGSTILWTTYLSGASDDFATGVAVTGSDQPYVVGYTSSCGDGGLSYATPGEFPFVGGVQPLCNPAVRGFNNYESNGGGYDAFLVKLSSDGKTELYGTPLGGSSNDIADSVALDASGKVYIVGETESTQYYYAVSSNHSDVPSYPINQHGVPAIGISNYPTTASAFYTNTTESKMNSTLLNNGDTGGPQDEQAFLTVLSPDLGTILYSSLIGGPVLGNAGNGTSATNGIAIAVNSNGIAYIGGNTSSAHWPVTAGALASTCANAGAANSTCNLTGWLAAFDATKTGSASLLFNTYVNGQTAGKDGNGNTLYPTSDVFGLTTDSAGNVIATGDTNAVDFPTTAGTLLPSCFKFGDGNGDIGVCEFEPYISKLNVAGALQWSTYLGAAQQDIGQSNGRGVAVDASNNVYLLATAGSPYLPTKNTLATPSGGDYYVAELNPTATTLLMGTYIGIGGGFSPNNNSLAITGMPPCTSADRKHRILTAEPTSRSRLTLLTKPSRARMAS
jgi:hypothetical protein